MSIRPPVHLCDPPAFGRPGEHWVCAECRLFHLAVYESDTDGIEWVVEE